ncbi:MAG TPA: thioredoxin domain-containing protein [Solirubrobacterales bacterium]|nr:thioredoxin domain-containing protein [Solirubrobacterales bacterium]
MQVVKENKLKCLFVLLSLALLIVVVTLAASGGGSTDRRQAVIPHEPNAARRAFALLSGIPQHGSILGYRKAPVTLQFFGDLQCEMSRQVMLGALPFLIRHWVRSGKLRIRFRSTETDTKRAGGVLEFREQQSAALAAGRQGKLWSFIDVFYREQGPENTGYVDEAFLNGIAAKAGVEMSQWEEDRDPVPWYGRIEADERLAKTTGVISTPSFLIGPTGGAAWPLRHFALEDSRVFDEAIRELL